MSCRTVGICLHPSNGCKMPMPSRYPCIFGYFRKYRDRSDVYHFRFFNETTHLRRPDHVRFQRRVWADLTPVARCVTKSISDHSSIRFYRSFYELVAMMRPGFCEALRRNQQRSESCTDHWKRSIILLLASGDLGDQAITEQKTHATHRRCAV